MRGLRDLGVCFYYCLHRGPDQLWPIGARRRLTAQFALEAAVLRIGFLFVVRHCVPCRCACTFSAPGSRRICRLSAVVLAAFTRSLRLFNGVLVSALAVARLFTPLSSLSSVNLAERAAQTGVRHSFPPPPPLTIVVYPYFVCTFNVRPTILSWFTPPSPRPSVLENPPGPLSSGQSANERYVFVTSSNL